MEATEHDFIQDEVGEPEKYVAQKFRDLCKDGKEKEGTKSEAARLICHLAKIYELKTKHKKLNMIRSAALYNAAIVREPTNQLSKEELKALCSAVLVKAGATKHDADLISLAAEVKNKLDDLRKSFGQSYIHLEFIPDRVEGDELIELQRKKVLDVKNIQQEVTGRYTELMRFISDECIKVMGEPPCKYAVVGLGSLARSEITPYSDFEHIIVLDNDVAKMEDRKRIMKYFRWFTTIFNIILINLGETMINCVAIPSINPRYRDWFTDIVTPNGVTFDGMVAHACKLPLGRPATKNRPWNTELIKPVDEMVKYLDSDEQVKQGYHLADVLFKACFVAGDEAICVEYQEKAYKRVKENDIEGNFMTLSEQIREDVLNLNFTILVRTGLGYESYNIKRAIYRGATIFISAIGRLHSLQESSCFDIIDGLEKKGICSQEVADQLHFMVAVACEVRAKVYHSKGQQDDVFMEDRTFEDIILGLIEIVGKQSFVSFMGTVLVLQQMPYWSDKQLELCFSFAKFSESQQDAKRVLHTFAYLFDGKAMITKLPSNFDGFSSEYLDLLLTIFLSYTSDKFDVTLAAIAKLQTDEYQRQIDEYFLPFVKFYLKVFELASKKDRFQIEDSKSEVKDLIQEVEKLVEPFEKQVQRFKPTETDNSRAKDMYTIVKFGEGLCFNVLATTLALLRFKEKSEIYLGKFEQIQEFCEQTGETEIFNKFGFFKIYNSLTENYPLIRIINENYKKAIECLDKEKQSLRPYKQTSIMHLHLHAQYGFSYFATGRYYEALICWLEYARINKKHYLLPLTNSNKQLVKKTFTHFLFRHPLILCESAKALINNGKYRQALKLLDEAKQMLQPYKVATTVVHMELYILYANCYNNTDRYYEPLICELECARICKKLKEPTDNDFKQWMKITFQRFIFRHPLILCKSARTLLINGKYTEALKLLDKAKQLMEPYKVATTVVHMELYILYANCYNNTDRYYEALICELECARICKKLKEPTDNDFKQWMKITFQQFIFRHPIELCKSAGTLLINGKYTEALKLLDKAKQLMEPYKNTTTGVHRRLYYLYKLCYCNTGRYYEAFICGLKHVRICNELERPIPDDIKLTTNLTFQLFRFRHQMQLCKSAETLMQDGKPAEALTLLDEAKQMMQPYKNTTTVVHMDLYETYAGCYHNTGRNYEALICWLEYARIGKKLKQTIPDGIKQAIKDTIYTLKKG